jgi:hypothetical protein
MFFLPTFASKLASFRDSAGAPVISIENALGDLAMRVGGRRRKYFSIEDLLGQ